MQISKSTPKISILVAVRKNSKYLAKFIFGYFANTEYPEEHEVLIMLNKHDTWNQELVEFLEPIKSRGFPVFNFYYEDMQLGRAGLHKYFNELAKQATGDWMIYFCEDHFIIPTIAMDGRPYKHPWDLYFMNKITELQLDFKDVYILVPKFDNVGAMNHMVSRGYYNAMGFVIGRHGWIDSYINDVAFAAWGHKAGRMIRFDNETFHDFSHDHPNPMDDAHLQSVVSAEGKQLPKHGSKAYWHAVNLDARKLNKSLGAK